MKKIFAWVIGIACICFVSYTYHDNSTSKIVDDIQIQESESQGESNENVIGKDEEKVKGNDNKIKDKTEEEKETNATTGEDCIQQSNQDELPTQSEEEKGNEEIINKEENEEAKVETTANAYSNLSNKTNAWGFVRKANGAQPEMYGPYTKVLDAYDGIYMGNNEEQVVYLTFDEGYENGYTGAILDTLKEKNVTAAFFVTMPYVKQNPDLVKRMIAEGHIVGNHTVNHPSMPEVTDDTKLINEVMELHNYVKDNFNYEMKYLRPPKGEYSERTAKLCLDLGYRHVLWSSAYDDWDTSKQDRLDYARKMILNNVHNGNVMLLHAVSKDNTALLGEVIDEIQSRGYEFLSLDEFEK